MSTFKNIIRSTEKNFDKIKYKVKDRLHLFDPVFIYPYRGYANQSKAYLHGRILEKEPITHDKNELPDTLWTQLKKTWKRYESDEIPGVSIEGDLHGFKAQAVSDSEGYFLLEFDGLNEEIMINGWHNVLLTITDMPFDLDYEASTTGEVLVCEQNNAFGIISDIDDTIIVSNAMKRFKRIITMMAKDAKLRLPFEGVSELYHALSQKYQNPLFFISGSSYNLYDMLIAFCEHHKIPKAPLFLRDLGIDANTWIKEDSHTYKMEYAQRILHTYPKLPFILIGDSGQEDPEIYLNIYQEHPDRVLAVYIRHVHSEERLAELESIKEQFSIPFLIMKHSNDALEHARSMGWT